jgi:ribosomal 50S subunit-associated protein YjgA (DUF615 family)
MKTTDFSQSISSARLAENMEKQFGVRVNLNKYDREQLEDIRNKLRTRVFQQEASAGVNDLLTNEDYQKDKAMLELLNIRIKEMLGEDIKKLRDKMDQLSESRKEQTDKKKCPPMSHIKKMCQDGKSVAEICKMHPDCDHTELKQMVSDCKSSMDEGKMPMKKVGGKSVPAFAADGKGKNDLSKNKDGKMKETIRKDKKGMEGNAYGNAVQHTEPGEEIKINGKGTGDIKRESMSKKCCCSTKGEEKCPVHGLKEVKMADLPSRTVKGKSYGNQDDYEKPPEDKRRPATTMPSKKDKKPLGEAGKHPKDCDCKECMGTMEGKGDGNLANNAKPYDKITRGDVIAGRLGKDEKGGKSKKKVKEGVFKSNVRLVNESLAYYLSEDEEGKAKTITAAGDMVNDFTSWMQRVGQYQTKAIIELSDEIRAEFGPAEAEAFKQAVGPALSAALETLTQQREAISNAVAQLATGSAPSEGMGMEPGMAPETGMDATPPDAMNPDIGASDEFGAADAAAGGTEASGREMRESRFSRRLQESHSIMSKLSI